MKSIGDRLLGVCVDWKHQGRPYTIPIPTTQRLLAIGRRCSVCSLPATRFGAKLHCHQRQVKRNGDRVRSRHFCSGVGSRFSFGTVN